MDLSKISSGPNPPEDVNVLVEVPLGGEPIKYEIDKASGAGTGPQRPIPGGLGGTVAAWAFAQWGGKFYIFVTTQDFLGTTNSTVRTIDRMTGQYQLVSQNLPYRIVGAGVSTCAPVIIGSELPWEQNPGMLPIDGSVFGRR